MEFERLGDPDGGPALDLDHERFAYAGKFVRAATGKAVARQADAIVGAAAFDRDRTDPSTVRVRYVTVRADRRGRGIGARLLAFVAGEVLAAGAATVRIAVNNPFAYEAAYKAGFGYTGEETGLAELELARPSDREPGRYRAGLDRFRDRDDLDAEAAAFLAERRAADPPSLVETPTDA